MVPIPLHTVGGVPVCGSYTTAHSGRSSSLWFLYHCTQWAEFQSVAPIPLHTVGGVPVCGFYTTVHSGRSFTPGIMSCVSILLTCSVCVPPCEGPQSQCSQQLWTQIMSTMSGTHNSSSMLDTKCPTGPSLETQQMWSSQKFALNSDGSHQTGRQPLTCSQWSFRQMEVSHRSLIWSLRTYWK